ncbi:MAG: beta-glucosidase family protein [Acidimicrobiales bacterium]
MSLDEKAALTAGADAWHTVGVDRLGIPPVKMTDGPNGARGATSAERLSLTPSSCIPCGSALGATWDPETVAGAGAAVARQARQKSARVLLAPTVNLQRHPLWGRNFECFSEDPFLSGKLAAAYIEGVQAQGVVATVKHLVCNESEHERRTSSSEVDERALRELYLVPFEFAVREARVQAVMTSYNRLNGRYVADDERILAEILRGEWGFDGIVMTDWWALASTVDAARAGLDLEMPGPGRSFGPVLAEAVRRGEVDEGWLDEKVRRLLYVFDRVGALEGPAEDTEAPADDEQDRALARRAAADAMVLLKNEGGVLPLVTGGLRRVALVGPAGEKLAVMGGGSARVVPHYTLSLAEALRRRLGAGVEVALEAGCRLPPRAGPVPAGIGPGDSTGGPGPHALDDGIARAVELAGGADVAVVVVGTDDHWESEGYDRLDMDLPGDQCALVERVVQVNPNTVVVLNTGAPVALPFAERVPALLQCWFGGQELANALVDVLVGDAEPGGRLPVTMPERIEHAPAFGNFPAESSVVRYGEGQLVGYRWYEARRLPVRFAFGHGLSYTTMRWGPARASSRTLEPGGSLRVEVEVENTGPRPGSEVVQIYVAPPGGGQLSPGGRSRPVKALKGFAKLRLRPGEKLTAVVELNQRSFAYYDVADEIWPALSERVRHHDVHGPRGLHRSAPGWYVDAGTYEVQLGRSSTEICERLEVEVAGSDKPLPFGSPPG